MTHRDDLDLMLTAWLDDPYVPPAPGYLGAVLERTRRTRQRPAWTSLERWLPMADKILRPALAPPVRVALLLLIVLLVAAFAVGVALVGSQLLKSDRPVDLYPIPRGGAAVIAYGSIVGDSSGQRGGHIFTVRADGTDLRQLTTGPGMEWSPVWSPDGTRIAYRVLQDSTDSVAVMDAGGGNRMTLATTGKAKVECVRGMAWSPDGKSLIFATPACNGRFDLFIVAADGSSPATPLLAPGTNGVHPAWSPDGKRIAFLGSDAAASTGLYVVDVGPGGALSGGLQARRIGPGPGLLADAASGPQWSPDGQELAVTEEPNRIVVVKADGSGRRVAVANGFSPSWSPDGRRLAFYRTVDPAEYFAERPCTVRAWLIDADGTNEHRLEELMDGCGDPPLWSLDGTRLTGSVIASTPAEPELAFHVGVVTIDGSSPLVILQDGGGTWQPREAPLPPAPSFPTASPSP